MDGHSKLRKLQQEIGRLKQVEESLQIRNSELALINHAIQSLNSSLETSQTLQTVLEQLGSLIDCASSSFWLSHPEKGELVCRHAIGPGSDKLVGWRLSPGQGITGHVALTGQSLIISDTYTDPRHRREVNQAIGLDVRSMISIPLQTKGETLGVLNMVDTSPNRFTEDDLQLLESIATTAASAIKNAQLFDETLRQQKIAEQRVKELSILNQISQTLATVTNLPEALATVAQVITHCFDGFSTSISIFDEARTTRTIAVVYQTQETGTANLVGRVIPISNDKTYQEYISQGKSLIIPDPQSSPYTQQTHKFIKERNLQCLMRIPLRAHGEIIGMISVSTHQPGRLFTPVEVKLAETIAGQIAGTIELVRLFDEEQKQRQLAESRNQELDAFARTVAHDIKSPLNTMMGFAKFVLQEDAQKLPPQQLKFSLESIHRTARKALNIVEELLLLAGVRQQSVLLEPIDMAQIVNQALERVDFMVEEYQGEIILPEFWPVARS